MPIFYIINDILYRLFVIIEDKKNIMGIICYENMNSGIFFQIEVNKIHKKNKVISKLHWQRLCLVTAL